MPRKSRKLAKTRNRVSDDLPNNLVGLRADFQSKPVETTATRGSPSSRKQNKKMKKDRGGHPNRSHHADCSEKKRKRDKETQTSSKKSSISFFISFDDHDHGYQEVPTNKVTDWDNISVQCHTRIELTCFPRELLPREHHFKQTEMPILRFECRRTVSESSSNSDDSFICFTDDDVHEDSFIFFEDDGSLDDSFIYFDDDDDTDNESGVDEPDCSSVRFRPQLNRLIVIWEQIFLMIRIPFQIKLNECIYGESSTASDPEQSPSEESSKKKKKVSVANILVLKNLLGRER